MNESTIQTLQLLFKRRMEYLCDNLDFHILKVPLISHDVLSLRKGKLIEKRKVKSEQISILIEFLIEKPQKIYLFLKILENESYGYKFVYDHLQAELTALDQSSLPFQQIVAKTKPSCGHDRAANLKFRHFLKRLVHSNKVEAFDQYRQNITLEWKHCTEYSQKFLLADRYCMVLDAELEQGLVKADPTLVKSGAFQEILKCSPYTPFPIVYNMLYLARFAYALLLAGKSFEEVMSHIYQARTHASNIEPCRETGIVMYILYNMKSVSYEKRPTLKKKMRLLDLAKQAIFHFGNESEVISEDYRRLFLIKMAMLYLGISIFGQNITNLSINREDIGHAKDCLRKVSTKKMWQRMEVRWKMFYYMCVVKYLQLKDPQEENLEVQIRLAKHAKVCSIKGGHY
ncbi:uncharacterized protein LOC134282401 [Saccostrea cucullata]|uniref:uncharacterized protein LOC134282401 n=1 Tax=Saccostrea cuccullata TaxID=36930 RepID=UPI002ED0B57B